MASGLILGIIMAKYGKWYLAALLPGILFQQFFEYVSWQRQENKKISVFGKMLIWQLLTITFFTAGYWHFQEEELKRSAYTDVLAEGKYVKASGTLSGKEYKNGQYVYCLDHCTLAAQNKTILCNQILFYQKTDHYSIGQLLNVEGIIKLWEKASNEGMFDADRFYRSRKIECRLSDAKVIGASEKFCRLPERLFQLRCRITKVYSDYLCKDEAGIIATMALGDKSLLDKETRKLYQSAGISHILAISGLHISLIGMGLYRFLRKVRCSFGFSGIIAGTVIIGYGILSGFGTSAKRAVCMFILMLIAQWLGRSYDTLSALGFSAIIILWENPYLITYEGFLLSYAAVLGIAVIGRMLVKIEKPFFSLEEKFLISLSIQIATVPLCAYFYNEIPVWSMLINFFVLPLIGLLLFLALAGGILGMFFSAPARGIFEGCHWILSFYRKVCEMGARLPGALLITGQPDIRKLILYYSILSGVLWMMKRRKNRRGFSVIAVVLLVFLLNQPLRGFEIDVLDVGQGDGIFLHSKSNVSFFFDGGSTDVKNVGEQRILPFLKAKGIQKIDYWVISHTDKDHISGLEEVLQSGYPVTNLIFSKYIIKDEAYEELVVIAENNGCRILKMDRNDAVTDGKMRLECVFPDVSYQNDDKNAMSLVVRYEENGFSGLFTGDISSMEEHYLTDNGFAEKVTYYKSAHHGSKHSNSAEFLKALSPEETTISCGRENSYGHPGKEAVSNIKESGSRLFLTTESGRIRLRMKDGKIIVDEYFKK